MQVVLGYGSSNCCCCCCGLVVVVIVNVLQGIGASSPLNDIIERISSDQPLSSPSNIDYRYLKSLQRYYTRRPPAAPTCLHQTGNVAHEADHPDSWCQPLHADNQMHRCHRWLPELRSLTSLVGNSDVLVQVHRPKPLRFRPYRDITTTNWLYAMGY